ncbi:MAG TPA: OsmC family protein [Thermoanaerobaculia bacterium]|jgi:osmotically inducible protein OsmC|nr:OsmC family protein [Thermoanaerobaculia bacterium]
MAVRTANAAWEGSLKEGKGTMRLGSGAWEGPFSFSTRFEDAKGTNPEELIGAALAGCFSMALGANLGRAGFTPRRIATDAKVHIEKVEGGFGITRIELTTDAAVPGVDEATFRQQIDATKAGCPVSKALKAVEISVQATLHS